ncbi:hypothetical protein EB796_023007 [Bugula neritina]|uniref:Uncharacterized protein n=1 Tax=Bugula neritina TaxID=10212 RepID=A0A7J7IYP1_BUGNE|nr:hypothetical protein EB796_023007 [Bugula neritina]
MFTQYACCLRHIVEVIEDLQWEFNLLRRITFTMGVSQISFPVIDASNCTLMILPSKLVRGRTWYLRKMKLKVKVILVLYTMEYRLHTAHTTLQPTGYCRRSVITATRGDKSDLFLLLITKTPSNRL